MKRVFPLIVVLALVLGLFGALRPAQIERVIENTGAFVGPELTERLYARGGVVDGGNCYSTTTTGTLTSSKLLGNSCLVIAAGGAGQAALTLTLQATSTMTQLIPNAGSCASWWIDATAVAAATTTTIVAGTGVNLVGLDATGAGTGADVIDGNEYGKLTLCRETDSDVTAFVEEWIHAD